MWAQSRASEEGGGGHHSLKNTKWREFCHVHKKNVTVEPKGGEHLSEGTDLERAIDQNETSLKMDSI